MRRFHVPRGFCADGIVAAPLPGAGCDGGISGEACDRAPVLRERSPDDPDYSVHYCAEHDQCGPYVREERRPGRVCDVELAGADTGAAVGEDLWSALPVYDGASVLFVGVIVDGVARLATGDEPGARLLFLDVEP